MLHFIQRQSKRAWMLYERYERRVGIAAFMFGFIFDHLTLTRVDLWFDNLVLLMHLSVVSGSIFLLHVAASKKLRPDGIGLYAIYLPLAMQFSFGNLLSGFFVFYSRSASLITSWPFLMFLGFLLLGNEFFRKHYSRFVFHTSMLFMAFFSYFIFLLPVLFGVMGAGIFLLSGTVSVLVIIAFFAFCNHASSGRLWLQWRSAAASIAAIYAVFNIMYFTNIIPPIPLSLKEIGVYHSVSWSSNGVYRFTYEPETRWFFFKRPSRIFHQVAGAPVYVYSAVFAPTNLTTKILHRWSYFDERAQEWRMTDRLSFTIVGGRDGGWRGFTMKERIFPARWRVDVITERDQLLGRIAFEVAQSNAPPSLVQKEE